MKQFGWRRRLLTVPCMAVLCLSGIGLTASLAQPQEQTLLARDVFLNVPVLGDLPVDEFMDTMGMYSASLSMGCVNCHGEEGLDGWENFAADPPLKRTARAMTEMVNRINADNFGGLPFVTCYTCHRGSHRPPVIPDLAIQYNVPPEDPHEIFFPGQAIAGMPTVDDIFSRYIEAVGGAARVASLTSFVARGAYSGYETEHQPYPVEMFAEAPDRRTTILDAFFGRSVRTFDGREGWIASGDKPVPLIRLTGGNLEGARTDAMLAFPAGVRQAFRQWRVGFPTFIGELEVQVVQGTNPDQTTPVNLYFDSESGLLVRFVRYGVTAIGTVPTQVDLEDYREVSGVLMPFRWTVTWTDGQSTVELNEIEPNVEIDATRFARPAAAELYAPN